MPSEYIKVTIETARKEKMERKLMPFLEARVNASGADDACCNCGLREERKEGATEIYVVGTERWVCANCALSIDADLASFAYDPKHKSPPKPRVADDDVLSRYFGLCPECGHANGYRNVGRCHWCYCLRHGLQWPGASNFFDDWREESMQDWWQNFLFLQRFRECEGWSPELSRWTRIVGRVRMWEHKLRSRLRRAVNHEVLFDDDLGRDLGE